MSGDEYAAMVRTIREAQQDMAIGARRMRYTPTTEGGEVSDTELVMSLTAEVERLTAERDRARATAVALEQELATKESDMAAGIRCFVEDHAGQIADLRGYLKDARESK